jgi:hypothetical protein
VTQFESPYVNALLADASHVLLPPLDSIANLTRDLQTRMTRARAGLISRNVEVVESVGRRETHRFVRSPNSNALPAVSQTETSGRREVLHRARYESLIPEASCAACS